MQMLSAKHQKRSDLTASQTLRSLPLNTVAIPSFAEANPAELQTPQRFNTVAETQAHLKAQGVSYVLS